jgi:hypothetical protein
MMWRARKLGGLAVVLLLACNSETLEVGSNDGGSKAASPEGSTGSTPVATVNGVDASALIGTWNGYVESFQFQSGTDLLVMQFQSQDGGVLAGTVTFGSGPPPPPATDGNVGYPPGISQFALATSVSPWEGFVYTAIDLMYDGTRLQLGVAEGELWNHWCPLLTVYGQGPDGGGPPYGCLPNWGFTDDPLPDASDCSQPDPLTGQNVPVDCGKLDLCAVGASVCTCSASGCIADLTTPGPTLDMQLGSNRLDGSIVLSGVVHNVHFTRSP